MYFRMGLLHRSSGMSREDFSRHWQYVHGPLAKSSLSGLRSYVQNHIMSRVPTDTVAGPAQRDHALAGIDGISKLGFDSAAAMAAAFAHGLTPVAADETHFLGHMNLFTGEDRIQIAPPLNQQGMLKRVSLLRRHAHHSPASFAQEWHGIHADLIRRMPGCRGYVQNRIEERFAERGQIASYEELPYDGIAELFYDDEASMRQAYQSEARGPLRDHARTLLGDIVTFVVRVVDVGTSGS